MNKVYRTEGKYDWLHPQDVSAQYVFTFRDDAPKELDRSFLVDINKDNRFSGSALDVAREIQEVYESYWIHTGQSKIDAVVTYLEQWEDKDYYDGLKEEREKLQTKLSEVEKKLSCYDPEEWDNWTPQAIETTESA